MAANTNLKYWLAGLPYQKVGGSNPANFKYWIIGRPFVSEQTDAAIHVGAQPGSAPELTVSLGNFSVTSHNHLDVSGYQVAASVGNAEAKWPAFINVTAPGIVAAFVGDVTAKTDVPVSIDADSQAVTVTLAATTVVNSGASHILTGQSVSASVGTATIRLGSTITMVGQAVSTFVGTADARGKASTTLTGLQLAASVSGVTIVGKASFTATGFQLVPAAGTASVSGKSISQPTGMQIATSVGTANSSVRITAAVTGQLLTVARGHYDAGGISPVEGWDWRTSIPIGITLTNAEMTADPPALFTPSMPVSIESTTSHGNGKRYAEVTVTGTGLNLQVGPKTGTKGAMLRTDGYIADESGTYPVFPPLSTGDIVGIAIDVDAGRVWFRVNGGLWNNDSAQGPV